MKDADVHKLHAKQKLRDSFCFNLDHRCNVTFNIVTTALEPVVVFYLPVLSTRQYKNAWVLGSSSETQSDIGSSAGF
jgi:hypothetical protein